MSRANPRFHRFNAALPSVTGTGVVEYIIQGSIEGQLTISTFFYQAAVPAPTQVQLTNLGNNLNTAFLSKYLALMAGEWTMTRQLVNVVHVNNIQGIIGTGSAGAAGTGGTLHQPTEVAAIVIRRSAVKGQHGRGRLSLPAVPLNAVSGSSINQTAYITNAGTLATQMLATVSDGTNNWTPVIAQRAPTSPRLVIGAAALSAAALNTLLGTVRRRRIGRGK